MGPLATQQFYETVIRLTDARRDQEHLPIVVEGDPTIPDRTAFLLGEGPDPRPALRAAAMNLKAAGATFLVMPCNTASAFEDDIHEAVALPLIPWVGTAVVAAVAASSGPVGVLATSGTIAAGIYHSALRRADRPIRVPTDTEQDLVMRAIYAPEGVKASGSASNELQEGLIHVAHSLCSRGATTVILGCTELPLAVPPSDPRWPCRVIDPALPVALKAIAFCGMRARPQT